MSRHLFSLGDEGEAAYRRLERSLKLGPGSGRAIVVSDSVDVRWEIRRRIEGMMRVEVVRPGPDVIGRIRELVTKAAEVVVVWVEGDGELAADSRAWRQTYAALNRGRDLLRQMGELTLVLAGPTELVDEVAARAPDLKSVIRPELRLGTKLDPTEQTPSQGEPGGDLDERCTRLRRIIATTYCHHTFIGMLDATPKPVVKLADVFVDPQFEDVEVRVGGEDEGYGLVCRGTTHDLAGVIESLDPVSATAGRPERRHSLFHRLVILGDPGSGKSMLSRWLAVRISERNSGKVPVLLRVRDGVDGSLVESSARMLESMLHVVLEPRELRGLFDEGRAVLIVDGLDEARSGTERQGIQEKLTSFAAAHPRAPIVVTCRSVGYTEAPLPFWTLRIRPFDDERLDRFTRKLSKLLEPRESEPRAAARAGLVAALAAEPRARELARNPLLGTLMALAHRHYGVLPSRRAELYRLVIELALEVWPRTRGTEYSAIDVGTQWMLLERLALWLQERREGSEPWQRDLEGDAGIVFSGDAFVRAMRSFETANDEDSDSRAVEALATVSRSFEWVAREEGSSSYRGRARELAEEKRDRQWLLWLARDTALLAPAGPGKYTFVHRTLMEYLASRGLRWRYREDVDGLAKLLASASYSSHWREIILLLLGGDADDGKLASTVVSAIVDHGGGTFEHRHMLQLYLGFLLDDLELPPDLVDQVLARVEGLTLSGADSEWTADLLGRVIDYSTKYGARVAEWLHHLLASGGPHQAASIAASCPARIRAEQTLAARSDIEEVGPHFLDALPVNRDDWAQRALSRDALVRWAAEADPIGTIDAALLRLVRPGPLARVWSLAVLGTRDPAAFIVKGARMGTDEAIRWTLGDTHYDAAIMPAYRVERERPSDRRPQRSLGQSIATSKLRDEAIACSLDWASDERQLVVALYGAWRLGVALWSGPMTDVFPAELLRRAGVEEKPSWIFASVPAPIRPDSSVGDDPTDLDLISLFPEIHAAQLLTPEYPDALRATRQRLDNRFIRDFFPGLAEVSLTRGSEHDCLPLLLALGLAQYQTTWSWPRGALWNQWLSGPAPADWLAAFLWHLCWAVGDVERFDEHYARSRVCLDRADWPELAQELRAHQVRVVTVREWKTRVA